MWNVCFGINFVMVVVICFVLLCVVVNMIVWLYFNCCSWLVNMVFLWFGLLVKYRFWVILVCWVFVLLMVMWIGDFNNLLSKWFSLIWLSVVENSMVWCLWWLVNWLIRVNVLVNFKFSIWLVLLNISIFKLLMKKFLFFKWLVIWLGVFIMMCGLWCSVLVWLL